MAELLVRQMDRHLWLAGRHQKVEALSGPSRSDPAAAIAALAGKRDPVAREPHHAGSQLGRRLDADQPQHVLVVLEGDLVALAHHFHPAANERDPIGRVHSPTVDVALYLDIIDGVEDLL